MDKRVDMRFMNEGVFSFILKFFANVDDDKERDIRDGLLALQKVQTILKPE